MQMICNLVEAKFGSIHISSYTVISDCVSLLCIGIAAIFHPQRDSAYEKPLGDPLAPALYSPATGTRTTQQQHNPTATQACVVFLQCHVICVLSVL